MTKHRWMVKELILNDVEPENNDSTEVQLPRQQHNPLNQPRMIRKAQKNKSLSAVCQSPFRFPMNTN